VAREVVHCDPQTTFNWWNNIAKCFHDICLFWKLCEEPEVRNKIVFSDLRFFVPQFNCLIFCCLHSKKTAKVTHTDDVINQGKQVSLKVVPWDFVNLARKENRIRLNWKSNKSITWLIFIKNLQLLYIP
jgi:hypothetical protein